MRTVRAVKRTYVNSGKSNRWIDEVEEVKRGWSKKRLLVRIALLYLAIVSATGMAQFVLMESVKNPSFSLGTCQTMLKDLNATDGDRNYVENQCIQAFELQKTQGMFAMQMNDLFGWLNPLTYPLYKSFFIANSENLQFEENLFSVAETHSYPYDPVKNDSRTCLKPSVVMFQFPEQDFKDIQASLTQYSNQGYYIKASYQTKTSPGMWMAVFIMEKITTVTC